jgi:hypothetical protein
MIVGMSSGQDCKVLLRNYVEKLSKIKTPEEGKTYLMDFVVSYHLWNSKESYPKSETKVILTSKGYFMESEMVSVYADEKEYFVIDHVHKQIIWNKGNLRTENYQGADTAMISLQKKFIEGGTIDLCVDTMLQKVKKTIIKVSAPKGIVEKYMIKAITYQYSYDKQQIDKVLIQYTSKNKLRDQTLEYRALDFNYKKWRTVTASELVLDNAGALISKYKTYSFIDNR